MSFEASARLQVLPDDGVAARRRALFRERPQDTVRRLALGSVWALRPKRIAGLPGLAMMQMSHWIAPDEAVPDPGRATAHPLGLCGIAHDLSAPVLIEAYRRGLYPHCHVGPAKWWSPPQRCILAFDDLHLSKRLRSRLRQNRYRVTFDRDFDAVMKACAAPRDGKWALTWITPRIMHAFAALHDAGHAHSYEVWNEHGELVAGGYGVAAGGCFTIESQFTRESHCSKIGFAVLNWHLAHWGFLLADNKGATRNTLEAGFRVVPRATFEQRLAEAQRITPPAQWRVEADLPTVAAWQPQVEAPSLVPEVDTSLRSKAKAALLVPLVEVVDGIAIAEAAWVLA